MFVAIGNTPRDYAWGSTTAIAELLGTKPSGGPEAELWLGAHPGSPARILDPSQTDGARDLAEWIAADPATALGGRPRLPFLLKVLAGGPLSLQAHPTADQAAEGFARENALGIPLDAPDRNYRDPHPKPEVIYALSETFEALCGFRPVEEARELLDTLGLDELVRRLDDLPGVFAWLLAGGPEVDALVARVAAAAAFPDALAKTKENRPEYAITGTKWPESDDSPSNSSGHAVGGRDRFVADALGAVRMLAEAHPGDAGIVSSLLLNHVTLARGEALYLPAGNIHAYLRGLGVEIMSASDNVLRGGLTPKHVDVAELLRVLDFTSGPVPWLRPDVESASAEIFRPGVDDFVLAHVTGDAEFTLTGPAIALCTGGAFSVAGELASIEIARGEAVYITPDEARIVVTGAGELFLATTP
jgi:mannose-6-phosphate isomerase